MQHHFVVCLIFNVVILFKIVSAVTEEDEGVKYANRCEGNS